MKKLPPPREGDVYIVGPKLFREHLDTIIDQFEGRGLRVRIISSEHSFDSLDEVKEKLGIRPQHLTVKGTALDAGFGGDLIRLSVYPAPGFGGFGAFLNYSERDSSLDSEHSMRILFYEIRDLLNSRVPKSWRFFQPLLYSSLAGTSFVLMILFRSQAGNENNASVDLGVLFSFSFFLFLILAALSRFVQRRITGIDLRYEHESGFISRNRQEIGFTIIGVVISEGARLLIELARSLSRFIPN